MSRWKASAVHFSISVAIAVSVAMAMLLLWYPPPYFDVMDGKKLLIILLGVDTVLGPLITLVIYNPAKKSLKFDLCIIAILQCSALAYGVNIMYQSRPAFVVFVVDRFTVVSANEIDPDELSKASRREFKQLPITGPRFAVAVMPTDTRESMRILNAALRGYDLEKFPQHYLPYEETVDKVVARARPLAELRARRPEDASQFAGLQQRLGDRDSNLLYLPLSARSESYTAVVNKADGAIVTLLRVDPWAKS